MKIISKEKSSRDVDEEIEVSLVFIFCILLLFPKDCFTPIVLYYLIFYLFFRFYCVMLLSMRISLNCVM